MTQHIPGLYMKRYKIYPFLEMVRRGLGWALMPEIALGNFDGCIHPCRFENGESFVRRTYLLCQKDSLQLPQVQAFMETLKKY